MLKVKKNLKKKERKNNNLIKNLLFFWKRYDLPKGNAGFLCVSQSGETADLRNALEMAKNHGVFTMGVINSVGS